MTLPSAATAQLFLLDPAAKYVTLNPAGFKTSPQTLSVLSAVERVSGNLIAQGSALTASVAVTNEPTWSSTAISGAFLNGTAASTVPTSPASAQGAPGFSFNGTSQFFEYDTLATEGLGFLDGYELGVCVTALIECATLGDATDQTVWSFGGSGGSYPSLSLFLSTATLHFTEVSSAGTTSATTVLSANTTLDIKGVTTNVANNGVHVVSCIKTAGVGGHLILRVDGVQVAPTAVTLGATETYTNFCVGAKVLSSGAHSLYWPGKIGQVSVFQVPSGSNPPGGLFEIENEMMLHAGVILGNLGSL